MLWSSCLNALDEKKICFVAPASGDNFNYEQGKIGGIELQLLELAFELTSKGNKVFIIRQNNEVKQSHLGDIVLYSIRLPRAMVVNDLRAGKIKSFLAILTYSFKAYLLINKIKPDVVIIPERFSGLFPSIFKASNKKILVVHVPPLLMVKDSLNLDVVALFPYYFLVFVEKLIYDNADHIVCLNSAIANYLSKRGYDTTFIANGIRVEKYYSSSADDGNFLLYVGRLVKEKGIDCLIKAYALIDANLREKYPLLIIGDGTENDRLVQLISSLNLEKNVKICPKLPHEEFKSKLASCTIFVLPSLFECMPVSLMEAMVYGRAIIASAIPGCTDLIIDGYNGLLFKPNNSFELKQCLETYLTNPLKRDEFGKNARSTIYRSFSFDMIGKHYNDLLTLLLHEEHDA